MQEAKQELQRETVEKSVKKTAPFFIGAIILAIIGGAGFQYWQKLENEKIDKASVKYFGALQKMQTGDIPGGMADIQELGKTGPKGYGDFAKILYASALQEKGETTAALAAFEEAAKSISDKDLKDIASLRAAYIAAATEDKTKMLLRLDALINSKSNFALLARELKAAILWKNGDNAGAKKEYELLQIDPNVPQGLSQRASQALGVINSGATASADLMPMQASPQSAQQAPQPNVERNAEGKRIVRLPPGMKISDIKEKIPDDVVLVETPLPAGAKPPIDAAATKANRAQMDREIELERQNAMKQQEAVTKDQVKQLEEVTGSNVPNNGGN